MIGARAHCSATNSTHNYYHTTRLSRFSDAYVRRSYGVRPLLGKRGGGFVFDTNTLHRAQAAGERERTVLIADFIETRKLDALRRKNASLLAFSRDL